VSDLRELSGACSRVGEIFKVLSGLIMLKAAIRLRNPKIIFERCLEKSLTVKSEAEKLKDTRNSRASGYAVVRKSGTYIAHDG
jgi:hypothetical protein